MTKNDAIARLKAHEAELRGMGIARLSLFGSVARGDERLDSDLDLAAYFEPRAHPSGLKYFGIEGRIAELVGVDVDLVMEPTSAPRLQAQIDRDRVRVF